MAKVFVEPKTYESPQFHRLCHAMQWDETQTLGVLLLFWCRTRNADVATAHISVILHHLPVPRPERQKLFEAMVETGYIRPAFADQYEIDGNTEFVELMRKRRASGRMGRASMIAALRKQALPKPANAADAATKAWEAYRTAYVQRYAAEPARNGKSNASIARIVAAVGGADAVPLMRFYVEREDPAYTRCSHDLGLAVRDAHHLHSLWQSQLASQWNGITSPMAHEAKAAKRRQQMSFNMNA